MIAWIIHNSEKWVKYLEYLHLEAIIDSQEQTIKELREALKEFIDMHKEWNEIETQDGAVFWEMAMSELVEKYKSHWVKR